jgi:uncharacterized membrane protein SpoIIM required for sporulation
MLESIIRYNEIEKHMWLMLLWAMLISSVGILFSVQLSYQIRVSGTIIDLTGLFSVLFTIIPSVYFITMFIKKRELQDEKDLALHYEKSFWRRHFRDILIFGFYFTGLTLSFAIWSFVLPAETFQIQSMKIQEIRTLAGNMMEGSATDEIGSFVRVLMNNLQVTGFAFIFSILFGAGAVFIVVWNASILGVFIGRLSESLFHIPYTGIPFLPHGIPEITGYVLAGVAGSLVSAAIIRGHKKDIMFKVLTDVMKLMALALFAVFLGALIETGSMYIKIASIFIFYSVFIYIITVAISPLRKNDR